MFIQIMSECIFQYSENLQSSIYGFMPSPGSTFHFFFPKISTIFRMLDISITTIATISFNTFTMIQHSFQPTLKNGKICPISSRKRALCPAYPSSLDAYSNFISKGSSIEFMRPPARPEIYRVQNSEVCSINSKLACASIIIFESV